MAEVPLGTVFVAADADLIAIEYRRHSRSGDHPTANTRRGGGVPQSAAAPRPATAQAGACAQYDLIASVDGCLLVPSYLNDNFMILREKFSSASVDREGAVV